MASSPSWKRAALVVGLTVVCALVISAFFFSYLLKRCIERNSEAWVDHSITMGSIVLNTLHGHLCHQPALLRASQ